MKNSKTPLIVVIGSLNRGGAETHLLNVLPGLNRDIFAPEVFVLTERGDLAIQMESLGVKVSTPWISSGKYRKYKWFRIFRLLAISLQLWKKLLSNRNSIVHFFLPEAYCIGGYISLLAGVRYRVMSRRSRNNYQENRPVIRGLEYFLHKTITAALGNSVAVVADLISEGIPSARICLLHNGINVDHYDRPDLRSKTRSSLGVQDGTLLFIMVANLIPYKGHLDLLRVMSVINSKISQSWHLLLVGRDDGIGSDLRNYVRESGLDSRVTFLGSSDAVPALLNAADVGFLVSHEEGFSNSVLEGMAAGLPMIVTNVGGNSEVIIDGENGYLIDPHDLLKLEEVVMHVINDFKSLQKMGERGKIRVGKSFSIKDCIKKYENFYINLKQDKISCNAIENND